VQQAHRIGKMRAEVQNSTFVLLVANAVGFAIIHKPLTAIIMKKKDPNKVFESIIKQSDLTSLSKDYGEILVDSLLDNRTLKDIPLIGTIVGSLNFVNSINQIFTIKKIYKFLSQLRDIPQEKRLQKINKINSSKKYQNSVGEQLFELLDKIESDGKPEILGKIFAAYIEEKIDYQTFLRTSHIIKNAFYYDLVFLKQSYDGKYLNHDMNIIDSLIENELVQSNVDFVKSYEFTLSNNREDKERSEKFIQEKDTLTEIGKIIIEIGMQ